MSWDPQVEKRVHPFGEAGVRSSLEEVCKRAAEDAAEVLADPKRLTRVRTWSIEKISDAKKRGESFHKPGDRARILLRAVQQKLWVPDPIGVEHIVKSRHTACDDHDANGVCVKGGDCDDLCVLLAACFMSVGLYTMIVGHSYSREKNIGHVLCKVYFDRKWHYADPSPLGNGKHMDLGECAPPTRERYYSMPTIKVVCDGTTCDRQTLDPHELGFVEEGHFVGVNGVTVYELPPEAPGPRVEWLGVASVVQWLGEGESKTDAVVEAATECGKLYSTDLDTKWGREQAFKNTAKCSADAACTVYSGGAIPPGVCGTIAGPIAAEVVKVWNSVFGDNEEAEKARQRDINTAKFVSMHDQMMTSDASWNAYYRGTMVRLIEFHDQVLPSRRGAWGGGVLTKDKTYWTDYSGKHHEYERQWYSNMCPVLQKLSVAGAPATFHKLSQCPGQIAAPALEDVYRDWSDKNPGVGAVAKSNKLYEIVNSTLPKWTAQLDKAAATLRNEAVIAAVHEKLSGGSAPKKTGAGTKILIGVSVAAAATYAASQLGWLSFLKRSA